MRAIKRALRRASWALGFVLILHPGDSAAGAPEPELETGQGLDLIEPLRVDDREPPMVDDNLLDDGPPTDVAAEILSDPTLSFCHDADYPLTEDEADWCPLLDEQARQRCPQFAQACTNPRAEIKLGFGGLGRTTKPGSHPSNPGKRSEGRGPGRTRDDFAKEETSLELPDLGPIGHAILWAIVAAMAVTVFLHIRRLGGGMAPQPSATPTPESAAAEATALPPPQPVPSDAVGLLARAEGLAAQGDFAQALATTHAVLLASLAQRGKVRLHPSRTHGDYLRELGSDPEWSAGTRQLFRDVDRVQYGGRGPSAEQVRTALAWLRSMIGSAAAVVLAMTMGSACDQLDGAKAYPWAESPSGTKALVSLLREQGLTVEFGHKTIEPAPIEHPQTDDDEFAVAEPEPEPEPTVPVVLDGAYLTDEQWSRLVESVAAGGHAVLATTESLPEAFGLSFAARRPGELYNLVGGDDFAGLTVAIPGTRALHHGALAAHSSDDDEEYIDNLEHIARVLVDDDGVPYALYVHHGAGAVLVFADDKLFTNGALPFADNGAYVAALLARLGNRFELIDPMVLEASQGGASDPFEAMGNLRLTLWLVHSLLFAVVLLWFRGAHFGKPRDPHVVGRRYMAEHVQALAGLYNRAGAKRHALRLYASWALERLRRRFGGRSPSLQQLARRLATHTQQDETTVLRTLVEAQDACDDPHDDLGDDADLKTLTHLGQLADAPTKRHES